MKIEKAVSGTEVTFTLSGWLETRFAPRLQEALDELDEKPEFLVFDLKDLEYISSSGLRLIVAVYKKMGDNMVLRNVSPNIMETLHLVGFDERMNIES